MSHSPLASPSATIAVLQKHGLYTKKGLGQHFLVDDNVIGRIIDLAKVTPDDVVIEVGPGIGTLTVALCEHAGSVVAIERDVALDRVLAETTSGYERFALIHADVLDLTAADIAEPFGDPSALVANLPYQVAATVVLRFFEMLPTLQQATVMVQAEVADRMSATIGTKNYGSYTVKLWLRARPAGRFNVAPGCFLPPPRVQSAVIRLNRVVQTESPAVIDAACRVADAAFAQRRKTVRNSLRASLGVSSDLLDGALEAAGIDGSQRAETLPPEVFITLAKNLFK